MDFVKLPNYLLCKMQYVLCSWVSYLNLRNIEYYFNTLLIERNVDYTENS